MISRKTERTAMRNKTLVFRKHKGNIGDILGTTLCLVCLMTVLVVSIQYTQLMELQRSVERIGRTAILLLEEQGELTASDKALLTSKVNAEIPDASVSITYNTSNRKVGYGEYVSFDMVVTCSADSLKLAGANGIFKDTYTFKTSQTSIAKH